MPSFIDESVEPSPVKSLPSPGTNATIDVKFEKFGVL